MAILFYSIYKLLKKQLPVLKIWVFLPVLSHKLLLPYRSEAKDGVVLVNNAF